MSKKRKPKRLFKLTFEFCESVASNYARRVDFKRGDPSCYNKSNKMGWTSIFFPEIQRHIEYTEEDFLTFIDKHPIYDLHKLNHSLYNRARKMGWYFKIAPEPKKITLEYCEKISKTYKTRKAFKDNDPGAYEYIRKNKLNSLLPKKMNLGWGRDSFSNSIRINDRTASVYFIRFRYNSRYVYKVGITGLSLARRFADFPHDYIVLWRVFDQTPEKIWDLEQKLLSVFENQNCHFETPVFAGYTECFYTHIDPSEFLSLSMSIVYPELPT